MLLHKVRYFCAYTHSMPLGDQERFCHGVVCGPAHIPRLIRDFKRLRYPYPILLDNGAFPAWKQGKNLDYMTQLGDLLGAYTKLKAVGIPVAWVVAPDVVGDGAESLRRLKRFLVENDHIPTQQLLFPIQEGMDIRELSALAHQYGAGLFVGGKSKEWKRQAMAYVRHFDPSIYLHVGRLSTMRDLFGAAMLKVNSFDNSTYMRAVHMRDRMRPIAEYVGRLEIFAEELPAGAYGENAGPV